MVHRWSISSLYFLVLLLNAELRLESTYNHGITGTLRETMYSIQRSPIPPNSLLHTYTTNGGYADAYLAEFVAPVSLQEWMFTFYTTPLFKVERWILRFTISKPSTDAQAQQLADGEIDTFAAWRLEARRDDEVLLCDISGRTRSWLKAALVDDGSGLRTRLYFGSAVVPVQDRKTGRLTLGPVFQSLLKFHQIYSVLLLYSARFKLGHTSRVKMRTKEFMNE